jgi:hypothetical protein
MLLIQALGGWMTFDICYVYAKQWAEFVLGCRRNRALPAAPAGEVGQGW